jgi:multiple sugar transport system permease protein
MMAAAVRRFVRPVYLQISHFAVSFTTETSMRTLSAGLLYMVGQYEVQWGALSAGVILSTVPVAVLFSFLQRHLIHGLTAGAVKG